MAISSKERFRVERLERRLAGIDAGPPGEAGAPGVDGTDGTDGTDGVGVPAGGTTGQVLAKIDGTDFNTEWVTPSGGGLADGDKGDITVSSSGVVWEIDPNVVTLVEMADVATGTVFYRKTAGTGDPEVQTLATLKTDLGLTGTNSGDQTITLTGDVTGSGVGSFAATIASGVIVDGDINASAAIALSKLATDPLARGNHTGTQTASTVSDFSEAVDDRVSALLVQGTDITLSYNDGANTLTINAAVADNEVTLAKMADVATGTVFYRKTAATGDPEVQTLATLKTDLGLTGTNSGDQTITLTGDVTGSGTGSFAATIATGVIVDADINASANIALSKLATDPLARGNHTGTQAASTISDFSEAVDDRVATLIIGGTDIDVTYNDGSNTLTIDSTAAGGSNPVTVVGLASDASANSTTTGVEITGLNTTLVAGSYVFQYWIRYQTAATGTGISFGVNYTGTATVMVTQARFLSSGTTAANNTPDQVRATAASGLLEAYGSRVESTTAPSLGPTAGVDTADTDLIMVVEGMCTVTNGGDLELWSASEVAASAVTVKAGSALILTKVA